jgi:hypothetical protein
LPVMETRGGWIGRFSITRMLSYKLRPKVPAV